MTDFLGALFDAIRYMRLVYAALLAMAFWGALRAGPRRSAKPAVFALLLIFLLSWPPASWLINEALEAPYRDAGPPSADVQAIVLFSGGSFSPGPNRPFTYLADDTVLRCRVAARVHAGAGKAPVIACGPAAEAGGDAVWSLMSRQLESWGVSSERILIERQGRSTHEQAVQAAEMLRSMNVHRIAVVTEGFHMRRALGCLRRQGFDVVAAPAGSRGVPDDIRWQDFVPSGDAIGANEDALREICALAVYKLRGRI